MFEDLPLASAAHLIQTALTPVFLLSGIAALLNVFASRLARVADRVDDLTDPDSDAVPEPKKDERLRLLRRRALILDVAVVLATAGAAAICLAILTLFLFALGNRAVADILLLLFGLAVVLTLGSVLAFGLEMLLSNRALRRRITFHLPHLGRRSH